MKTLKITMTDKQYEDLQAATFNASDIQASNTHEGLVQFGYLEDQETYHCRDWRTNHDIRLFFLHHQPILTFLYDTMREADKKHHAKEKVVESKAEVNNEFLM